METESSRNILLRIVDFPLFARWQQNCQRFMAFASPSFRPQKEMKEQPLERQNLRGLDF